MSVYQDFANRWQSKFRMFATAVAGERALAVATGLPPGSTKQWTRANKFREGLLQDAKLEFVSFAENHLANASDELKQRGAVRIFNLYLDIATFSQQIINQTNRQATFGLQNPINALRKPTGKAIGELVRQRLANPDFKIKDHSGRDWNADKLVNVVARDFAYQIFIDQQFSDAVSSGVKSVSILNSANDISGDTFELSDGWLQRRDQIFHINSNKTVGYAVQT